MNCKSKVKMSVEIFERPNTMEEATNGGGFSPAGGDEFVVGQSCDRVGIQNCRKGSKRSKKDSKRFSLREEGKFEKVNIKRTLEEKNLGEKEFEEKA